MTAKQEKELYAKAKNYFDTILATYSMPNFLEVVGRRGGDTLTFRFYTDGEVYER